METYAINRGADAVSSLQRPFKASKLFFLHQMSESKLQVWTMGLSKWTFGIQSSPMLLLLLKTSTDVP